MECVHITPVPYPALAIPTQSAVSLARLHLLLGGEIDFVRRVAAHARLITGTRAGSPKTACAGGAGGGLDILSGGLRA